MDIETAKVAKELDIAPDHISPLAVRIMRSYASDKSAPSIAKQFNDLFRNQTFYKPGWSEKELEDANKALHIGFTAKDIQWALGWFCRGIQLTYDHTGRTSNFEAEGKLDGTNYGTSGFLLNNHIAHPDGRSAQIQSFAYCQENDTIYLSPATLATMIIEGKIGKKSIPDGMNIEVPAYQHLAIGGAEESHHAWQRKNPEIWQSICKQARGGYIPLGQSGSHVMNPRTKRDHLINVIEDMTDQFINSTACPIILSLEEAKNTTRNI